MDPQRFNDVRDLPPPVWHNETMSDDKLDPTALLPEPNFTKEIGVQTDLVLCDQPCCYRQTESLRPKMPTSSSFISRNEMPGLKTDFSETSGTNFGRGRGRGHFRPDFSSKTSESISSDVRRAQFRRYLRIESQTPVSMDSFEEAQPAPAPFWEKDSMIHKSASLNFRDAVDAPFFDRIGYTCDETSIQGTCVLASQQKPKIDINLGAIAEDSSDMQIDLVDGERHLSYHRSAPLNRVEK